MRVGAKRHILLGPVALGLEAQPWAGRGPPPPWAGGHGGRQLSRQLSLARAYLGADLARWAR